MCGGKRERPAARVHTDTEGCCTAAASSRCDKDEGYICLVVSSLEVLSIDYCSTTRRGYCLSQPNDAELALYSSVQLGTYRADSNAVHEPYQANAQLNGTVRLPLPEEDTGICAMRSTAGSLQLMLKRDSHILRPSPVAIRQ